MAPALSGALPPIQSSKTGPGIFVLLPSLKTSRVLRLPILVLPCGCRQQAALPGGSVALAVALCTPLSLLPGLGAATVPLAPGCKFGSVPGSASLRRGWGP